MNFVPIQNSTHFSLLNSISTPKKLIEKSKELGYSSVGLTDYHSISGAVEFQGYAKKAGLKSILGAKLRVDNESYLTVIAKNLAGWKTLVKLISRSNDEEVIKQYGKPLITIDRLKEFDLSNLILILGDIESELFHQCFSYHGFACKDDASASLALSSDIENKVKDYLSLRWALTEDVFLQVNSINRTNPYLKLINEILRKIGKDLDIPILAGTNSHYVEPTDAADLKVLACSDQKTTFNKIDLNNWRNNLFFGSTEFHLPTPLEVKEVYLDEEIENTVKLAELCENYSITNKPELPSFECPNGLSEIDYLRQLAREGYAKKNKGWDKQVYGDRAKYELAVLEKAGLTGYTLIVQDYVNWAKTRCLVGPSRGSSAGSLISYLVGITAFDPIPYGLLFERYYNEGRNTDNNIEFPDIDIDFPKFAREDIISYIRHKYEYDKTGRICTFGSIKGRSAIREVMRVHGMDSNLINEISKKLPEESKIADKLEEDKEISIIRWTLLNRPKNIENYCTMDEDGNLRGELAQYFEQAIRIEGVYKNQGIHAAGLVISKHNLEEVCPMIYHAETKQKIVGVEMDSAKKLGCIKFDILGNLCLDRLQLVGQLLRGGI